MLKYVTRVSSKSASTATGTSTSETKDETGRESLDLVQEKRTVQQEKGEKRSSELKRQCEDVKRSRRFSQSWTKSFPWVKFENNKMFCKTCLKYPRLSDKDSKFVKDGCTNFHVKSLQTPHSSRAHKNATAHENAISRPGENPAEKALQVLNEQHFEKLRILFRIAHSIQTTRVLING